MHAHEDRLPTKSPLGCLPPTPQAPEEITPGSSENPAIILDISGRDPALDHFAEIILMVDAVALSVKHSNQLQAEALIPDVPIAHVSRRTCLFIQLLCLSPYTQVRNALVITKHLTLKRKVPAARPPIRSGRLVAV